MLSDPRRIRHAVAATTSVHRTERRPMPHRQRSYAPRARSLFILLTLVVAFSLAFMPGAGPAIALSDDPSPAATPDPTPDPTPEPTLDATPVPAPDPTPDPTQAPAADPTTAPGPDPTPDVTPAPAPDTTPEPLATPGPDTAPAPDPTPAATMPPDAIPLEPPQPTPDPATDPPPGPTPTPIPMPDPVGSYALRFGAAEPGAALTSSIVDLDQRAFTVEAWLRRQGPGITLDGRPAGEAPGAGVIGSAIPLVAHGSIDPARQASDPLGPAEQGAWILGLDGATGTLLAAFVDATGATHVLAGATAVADDAWAHAAMTFDGDTWRLYLDGRVDAEARAGWAPDASAAGRLALAASVSADGRSTRGAFDGTLDEIRLWRGTRTRSEILEDMHQPIVGSATGLVAAWALDQDQGLVAPDSVAPGVPLELIGDADWIGSPLPDATAPPPPVGLAATVTDGGVRLDWEAVQVADLAGYAVYRAMFDSSAAMGMQISGWRPISSDAFVDPDVTVGLSYRYIVTAIDRFSNESAASVAVTLTVDQPPVAQVPVGVTLELTSPMADVRVEPGSEVAIDVAETTGADLATGMLVIGLATGWTLVDADGGQLAPDASSVSWGLVDIAAGATVRHTVRLTAPLVSPIDGGADMRSTFTSRLEQAAGISEGPTLTLRVAPKVVIEHTVLGQIAGLTLEPTYRPPDAAISDQQRFEVFRVRFRVENGDDVAVDLTPRLEVRSEADTLGTYELVPALEEVDGLAFYATREWRSSSDRSGGTELGDEGAAIAVDAFLTPPLGDAELVAVAGHQSTGVNPAARLTLPPRSFTEVEFSVRATTAAPYETGWLFRMTDGGSPVTGAASALVSMGARPPLALSPGQRQGQDVGRPDDSAAARGALVYRLLSAPIPGPTSQPALLAATGPDQPHGPYGMTTDQCASCHTSHAAKAPASLLSSALPQTGICFKCHDSAGTGATTRVALQYADPLVPEDSPTTGSYYRHDAEASGSGHTLDSDDEFSGVADRHSECADCHDPHAATGTESIQASEGWSAPGQLANVSGVAVENGAAYAAPRYALLDGATTKVTLEYQLCLKCHSGWTELPARDPDHPSRWAEDKGVELNPANDSYHPIEGPGRNQTAAMANSLSGTSPYKLWTFSTDSTVRCVNCHGDYRKADPAAPPAAGSDLAAHTSRYRGLLIQAYRDRDLKPYTEPYAAQDFALCYVCHAEAPFTDSSGNDRSDTNFRYHGLHLRGIRNRGSLDGDIDTASAGRGNAICAECHFRTHSTAFAGDFRTSTRQTGTNAGLVNFAPNVTSWDGYVDWTRSATKSGTCTLTCHGYSHEDKSY